MPKVVPIQSRTHFDALLNAGHTIRESCRRAGVSESWGKNRKKELIARGKLKPRDSVAPKVTALSREGRSANEISDILGLPKPKVENYLKHGVGEGKGSNTRPDEERIGPIPVDELSEVARDCLNDFGRFRARYLASISTPWQEEAAQKVVEYLDSPEKEYVVLNCAQGSGKCQDADALVDLAGGSTKRVGDLQFGDVLVGMHGPTTVIGVEDNGTRDLYALHTRQGRRLTMTGNHPVWTPEGWVLAADMAGHHVMCRGIHGRSSLSVDEARMMGYMIGDGCLVGSSRGGSSFHCNFTNADLEILDDFEDLAEKFGWKHTRVPERNHWRVNLAGGAREWFRKFDMGGHSSRTKRIPEAVWRATPEAASAFLTGLFDTDGTVGDPNGVGSPRIEWRMASEGLIRDIQKLLVRFGIGSRKSYGVAKCNGKSFDSWRLTVSTGDAALFAAIIKPVGPKSKRLAKWAETYKASRFGNQYVVDRVDRVELVGAVPTIGIQTTSQTYCTEDVVTHNTRLFSHDIPAWITARNRASRGIIGSLTQNVSQRLTGNIRDTLERTVPAAGRPEDVLKGLALERADATLAAEYGAFKPHSGGNWRTDQFTVAQIDGASVEKEPTWAAFSRDAKFLGWRVDFMVWDDLVNMDMLRNQDKVQDLYDWWNAEAESRLDPGGLLMLVGQRLRSNDIYRFCLDKRIVVDEFDEREDAETRPQYRQVIYRAHYDDRCTGNKDDHRKSATPYPEGCMLDPNRVTWRDIQEKKAAGTFEVVYQQEDSDPSNVLVQKEWVNGGRGKDGADYEGCYDKERIVGELPPFPAGSKVVRYMTVDPSPTKFWSCQDVIYVLPPGTERLAGYRYLIRHARKKMGANDFLDWSRDQDAYLGLAEDWVHAAKQQGVPIQYLIMEKNAAQRWAMQYEFFRMWSQTRGIITIGHETTNNKSDPDFGIWNTIPNVYRHGRFRLPGGDAQSRRECYPLVQEVTMYPSGATDDCVMSQWFGEYNLQNLVPRSNTRGTMFNDMPSWLRNTPQGVGVGYRVTTNTS